MKAMIYHLHSAKCARRGEEFSLWLVYVSTVQQRLFQQWSSGVQFVRGTWHITRKKKRRTSSFLTKSALNGSKHWEAGYTSQELSFYRRSQNTHLTPHLLSTCVNVHRTQVAGDGSKWAVWALWCVFFFKLLKIGFVRNKRFLCVIYIIHIRNSDS